MPGGQKLRGSASRTHVPFGRDQPCRTHRRAYLTSVNHRVMDVVAVDTEHRIKALRPNHFDACPDALLPAPRRQRRGRGHDRRPRLPSSRNRLSRKDIAHKAGGALAHFAQPDASWADRILEPEDQERQAHGAPIPQLRQLPAPPTSQPRPNPEQSPDITDPNPPSQLGGVEPEIPNPRRGLPDRIRATRDRIRTGGVIASVPTFNAETSLYRESGQYRQTTDHRQSAIVPAASCTATATASLRAEPSITVTAIISARCRRFLNPTRT